MKHDLYFKNFHDVVELREPGSSNHTRRKVMPNYILLLTKGDFTGYSPDEMKKIEEKYVGWSKKLRAEGRYKAGEELARTGRVLRREKNRVVDGPFAETKEAIGGFFMFEAKDYEEAVEIARGCPHLEFQGEIELRETIPH
jgi:hypothetical protein